MVVHPVEGVFCVVPGHGVFVFRCMSVVYINHDDGDALFCQRRDEACARCVFGV